MPDPTENQTKQRPAGDDTDPQGSVELHEGEQEKTGTPAADALQSGQGGPKASPDSPEGVAAAADTGTEDKDQWKARLERADKDVLIAQAELENFRKRTRREMETQVRYAVVPMLQDILQVRDNLHRALEAAGSPEPEQGNGLRDGVAMVAKMLDDTLSKHGCQPIPGVGESFDPNFHEAISQVPSDEHPAGVIAHEAVKGFQLHDRVVRPSQVVVSTGPATN